MKILVLNGSPKGEKSDTMCITRAFIEGMEEAGPQEVHVINAIEKHVEYCTGCFACMRGGECAHDDDMKAILREITESELLIMSFPLYCYGMPAPLKAIVDRILPLSQMTMQKVGDRYVHVEKADHSRLSFLMICGCGFPNSRHNFEPAAEQFRLMFPERNTVVTIAESPLFNAPGAEPVTKPKLELVRGAGREYASSGTLSEATLNELSLPMIPEEVYASIVNGNS